jgi:hypothetical protein
MGHASPSSTLFDPPLTLVILSVAKNPCISLLLLLVLAFAFSNPSKDLSFRPKLLTVSP